MALIDYAEPASLTALTKIPPQALAGIPDDPIAMCRAVSGLIIQPGDAREIDLPPDRFITSDLRPAAVLVGELLRLKPVSLAVRRAPEHRIVGTCRHYAVLCCALLRHRGIPARARCGFAMYFRAGLGVDHWIIEYHDGRRWVRVDPEILGSNSFSRAKDLQPNDFYAGGEAWRARQQGVIDATTFGVYGTENWGTAEIRGNAVRDLAALNKVEMLPWDEWGRMSEAYDCKTDQQYDDLLDRLAAVCIADDLAGIAELYTHPDLAVPDDLLYPAHRTPMAI